MRMGLEKSGTDALFALPVLLLTCLPHMQQGNRALVLIRPGCGLSSDQASGLDPQVRDQKLGPHR